VLLRNYSLTHAAVNVCTDRNVAELRLSNRHWCGVVRGGGPRGWYPTFKNEGTSRRTASTFTDHVSGPGRTFGRCVCVCVCVSGSYTSKLTVTRGQNVAKVVGATSSEGFLVLRGTE